VRPDGVFSEGRVRGHRRAGAGVRRPAGEDRAFLGFIGKAIGSLGKALGILPDTPGPVKITVTPAPAPVATPAPAGSEWPSWALPAGIAVAVLIVVLIITRR